MHDDKLIVMKTDSEGDRKEKLEADLANTYIKVYWDKEQNGLQVDVSGSVDSLRFIVHLLSVQDKKLYEKVFKWLVERVEHQRNCSCSSCARWRAGTGFQPTPLR